MQLISQPSRKQFQQLRASVSKGEQTRVGFYNLLPLLRWTQYLTPHRMQNCKKIVLIQYQNLHKCSVKRPVSLAWSLHVQSAGTSTGVTAVHTYREIGIQQLKLNSANNMARKQHENRTDSWLGWELHQKPRRGQWFKTQGWILHFQLKKKQWMGVLLDQRPHIQWYQVKITTEINRITAAN